MHRRVTLFAGLVVLAATMLAPRPAAAGCSPDCPVWVNVFAGTLAVGVIGGYAYGTGYTIYRDVRGIDQTPSYGGTELIIHGSASALFTGGAVDAIRRRSALGTVGFGALAALHGTLAVHGATVVWRERRQLGPERLPPNTLAWTAGIVYGAQTAGWALLSAAPHGRTYGIVEASVNGAFAIGLGYLAIDRARDGDGGPAILLAGCTAISGALTYHGLRTALVDDRPGLDLLGTDLMPVAVSDGRHTGAGLGVAGSW